jgi:hypothetical protein
MHSLYQRLRELDWDTFQKLAYQILSEKHPGLEIKHVDGKAGGQGLDLFEGTLTGRSTIWQCKHFPNGLTPKQRPQVKESLASALEHFTPKQWVLVVSVDLDAKAHQWFQKLQKSYAHRVSLGLFQASNIVRELIHRRNIRDAFFPGAVLDTIAVRRSLESLDNVDAASLEALSTMHLDEQIARLEEADARFTYRISYGPNTGPDLENEPPLNPLHVASVTSGTLRTDVFVRDVEGVRMDPPAVKFSIKEPGLAKFQNFIDTGRRQEFSPDEITRPTSTFDFLFPERAPDNWKVILSPKISNRIWSLRLSFFKAAESTRYELIKFRVVATGVRQLELESTSNLPFALRLRLPKAPGMQGHLELAPRYEGFKVSAISKAIRARMLLQSGGQLELYSLDLDRPIDTLDFQGGQGADVSPWEAMILAAGEVAAYFQTDFPMPREITEDDARALTLLLAIARGGSLSIGDVTVAIRKCEDIAELLKENATRQLGMRLPITALSPPPLLFGGRVIKEPLVLHSVAARLREPDEFLRRFAVSGEDEVMPIQIMFGEIRAYTARENDERCYLWAVEQAPEEN